MILEVRFGLLAAIGAGMLALGGCVGSATDVPVGGQIIEVSRTTASPDSPTTTPSRTVSPQEQATWQAGEAKYGTAVALATTEAMILPGCGGSWDHSESPDGAWKSLHCTNDGMGVYSQKDHSKAWYFSYFDVYGSRYQGGIHRGRLAPVHWSDDGKYLYFVAVWSGDGGCVMYDDGSALFKLDLSTGKYIMLIAPTSDFSFGSFSFSNGDAYVAYIGMNAERHAVLTLLDLHSDARTDISLGNRYLEAGNVIWSPDNRRILFSADAGDCGNQIYYLVLMDLQDRVRTTIAESSLPIPKLLGWNTADRVLVQEETTGNLFYMGLPSGATTPYTGPTLTPAP